jgi:purine-binding chemotaxis protein CheW
MTERDLVSFRVGDQLCAVEASQVREVFYPRGLTPTPLAAPEILGVLNLRGHIVTLICARRRLGLEPQVAKREPIALGFDVDGDSYGLVVDSVSEVRRLRADEFRNPPGTLPARWSEVMLGICQLEDELLLVLDPQRLLQAA